jgi:peroxiredoxin
VCRREAPGVEQFARQHADDITVIGLGTQDTLAEADEFAATYETTFPMLWDETFETWSAIGVSSQPAAVLFAADGTPLAGWRGAFPEDEVLDLARNA